MTTTLIDRIHGGMDAEARSEAKELLSRAIATTSRYLDALRRKYVEVESGDEIPVLTLDPDGFIPREQLDMLLSDTQVIDAIERAAMLDDDAHTPGCDDGSQVPTAGVVTAAEAEALRIDAQAFALEPYDSLK